MTHAAAIAEPRVAGPAGSPSAPMDELIEHLAHLLPSQGPITVFVHHNTIHAFENLAFHEAVLAAGDRFDCHPYLPEDEYRFLYERGRISLGDIEQELHDSLDENGDELLGSLGTRHELWLSMLRCPLREGIDAEIRWFIDETEALNRFRHEAPIGLREQAIAQTRRWLLRDFFNGSRATCPVRAEAEAFLGQSGEENTEAWSAQQWESCTLHLLWATCRHGASLAPQRCGGIPATPTRAPADDLVDAELIRFCAAFLDQGFAAWPLDHREAGLFKSFLALHRDARPVRHWLKPLAARIREIDQKQATPADVIQNALDSLRVPQEQREEFLQNELLKLRGWAGMIWQMETNAEWAVRPAPRGTLLQYVAVRLLLLELAQQYQESTRRTRRIDRRDESPDFLRRAFLVFQIAQVRGWSAADLLRLSPAEWALLLGEIDSFSSRQRRRIYHQAYERHYRDEVLGAIRSSARAVMTQENGKAQVPAYQVVCCIDDREESFRRHLEEVDPGSETVGFAGFFGVAMYYRGVSEAHFRPLCPVNVKPSHWVQEEPLYSAAPSSKRRASARKALGRTAHRVTTGSRSFAGGLVTGVLGSLAAAPLVLRILLPRLTARLRSGVSSIISDSRTQLQIEASAGPETSHAGYSVDEMATIVASVLRSTGLSDRLAELVLITGHGSSSLNNPHAAAYDCGACGGGRGGPNARAFALMANDPRVRELLKQRGRPIPDTTTFVGAYHNTCNDAVDYYDLDDVPATHRQLLERATAAIEEARQRDAHERCRRFESAPLSLTPEAALRHVESRAEDLSQVRSECGHATNAICLVGRRGWSRGLYLDRRAFLTSYDPALDDEERSVLAGLLSAVIPVCAGINLEYYFSRIDNKGYGCGTKLPHNITSLLGVMDGAGSDLRTGLPWQMVEIHEPVRILFVVETSPEAMLRIMANNPAIDTLVRGGWVQLATLDPATAEVKLFNKKAFEPYDRPIDQLPAVKSSLAWYRGQRDHLGFAMITPIAGAEQ